VFAIKLEVKLDLKSDFRGEFLIIEVNKRRATLDLASEMREKIISEINHGNGKIIVNLSYVEFIDSSFLGSLVAGVKLIKEKGGKIIIVGLHPHVRVTFELTHMDKIFPVYSTIEDAMRKESKDSGSLPG
jgi:anti-anti-sigma factor